VILFLLCGLSRRIVVIRVVGETGLRWAADIVVEGKEPKLTARRINLAQGLVNTGSRTTPEGRYPEKTRA